jgi:SHS2 domain-containing protein
MNAWETFHHQADVGIRGTGDTLAEAFAQAAIALTAAITEPDRVRCRDWVEIRCEAPETEVLLLDWINAIVYEMATRKLLFSEYTVNIDGTRLEASACGEPVDLQRHAPAVEVKGATFTELRVSRQADGRWLAQCVVDV